MAASIPEQMPEPIQAGNPVCLPVSAPDGDAAGLRARDRVLLYTRGMDVEPLAGLEYALDSLRRAGPQAGPTEAMTELRGLLREHDLSLRLTGPDGQLLRSVPAMNRRRMIAEEMDRLPLLTAVRRWLRRLAGLPNKGRG